MTLRKKTSVRIFQLRATCSTCSFHSTVKPAGNAVLPSSSLMTTRKHKRPFGCSTASRSRDGLWLSTKPALKRVGPHRQAVAAASDQDLGRRHREDSVHPAHSAHPAPPAINHRGTSIVRIPMLLIREPTNTLASSARTPNHSRTAARRCFDLKVERKR